MTQRYDYHDLKTLMQRLRTPGTGCPWDLEQTYESIVPHTLEEVYEVIDTIERGDYQHLREELGDLVFQVVFYAQIASEEQRFDLDDVIHDLVAKLISRHPHVFPAGTLESQIDPNQQTDAGTVNGQWDQLKDVEKQSSGRAVSLLDDVPRALPGLLRARKLQKRAARVGFDWPDVSGVFDKVDEELAELREAAASGDADHTEEELGDRSGFMARRSAAPAQTGTERMAPLYPLWVCPGAGTGSVRREHKALLQRTVTRLSRTTTRDWCLFHRQARNPTDAGPDRHPRALILKSERQFETGHPTPLFRLRLPANF